MILCWFRKCYCGIKHQKTILAGTLVLHTRDFCWFQKWQCGMKLLQDILACARVCVHMVLIIRVWLKKPNCWANCSPDLSSAVFCCTRFIHGLNLKTDFLTPDSFMVWIRRIVFGSRQIHSSSGFWKKCFCSRQMQFMVWIWS
jgi:hypothetical protein